MLQLELVYHQAKQYAPNNPRLVRGMGNWRLSLLDILSPGPFPLMEDLLIMGIELKIIYMTSAGIEPAIVKESNP